MRLLALGLVAGLAATPVFAQDEWKADKETCIGAYGALANQKDQLVAWAPALAKSNLGAIDWAGRRTRLLNGSPIYDAAAGPYEQNFEMMMTKDRIDGGAKGTATVLEVSQRCDAAFGLSPSFAIPQK